MRVDDQQVLKSGEYGSKPVFDLSRGNVCILSHSPSPSPSPSVAGQFFPFLPKF